MSTIRMQFEVPAEKAKEIEALIRECGFESKKDFFNNAITLLKWVARHTRNGNIIASIDKGSERYTEFSMPFIEHIREQQYRSERREAAV
jgi:hypothetical protein